jgi:undecaprenyl diphosphate synthase
VIFRAAKAAPRTVEAGVGADESGGSAAGEAGVECLTLYAFSSENWRRSAEEKA